MTFLAPDERTYLFQALDPLHVGTGGTRIGRVDNLVARDPATRLPKIPGSGLSGAIKDSYDLFTLTNPNSGRKDESQRCAGANGCGNADCPVCGLFGTAPAEDGGIPARRGLVAFKDGLLVAMPVATLKGPCWMVRPEFALKLGLITAKQHEKIKGSENVAAVARLKVSGNSENKVSLAGYLLDCPAPLILEQSNITQLAGKLNFLSTTFPVSSFKDLVERMVVCDDPVFQALCTSAMEVRTSVTIDPDTGAAVPKKLFTLEAIPTGALFETRLDFLGGSPVGYYAQTQYKNGTDFFEVIEERGFPYLEFSGIGGNVTRGYGRVRFFSYWK